MKEEERLLDKFIEEEKEKQRIGSGDDLFYEQQIEDYINQQREFWLRFIRFLKKEFKKKLKEEKL